MLTVSWSECTMPLFATDAAQSRKTYVIAEMAWALWKPGSAVGIFAAHTPRAPMRLGSTCLPAGLYGSRLSLSDGQTLSGAEPQQDGEIYRYLDQINLTQEQWQVFLREARKIGMDICAMCNDGASLEFARSQEAISVYAIASACFTESDFVREIAPWGSRWCCASEAPVWKRSSRPSWCGK
jgi:hypothetical protein